MNEVEHDRPKLVAEFSLEGGHLSARATLFRFLKSLPARAQSVRVSRLSLSLCQIQICTFRKKVRGERREEEEYSRGWREKRRDGKTFETQSLNAGLFRFVSLSDCLCPSSSNKPKRKKVVCVPVFFFALPLLFAVKDRSQTQTFKFAIATLNYIEYGKSKYMELYFFLSICYLYLYHGRASLTAQLCCCCSRTPRFLFSSRFSSFIFSSKTVRPWYATEPTPRTREVDW